MSGSTGMAPRACQKSPRKTTPAERASASSWTARSTSIATGAVRRLTWRSLKTIQRFAAACAGPKWSSARTVRGGAGTEGVPASRATALLFVSAAKRARDRDGAPDEVEDASSDADGGPSLAPDPGRSRGTARTIVAPP